MSDKESDHVTGVETTGHTWDGDLKELNKPLPKWWLYEGKVRISSDRREILDRFTRPRAESLR